MNNDLSFDLDSLAVDVFALTEGDTAVESLTGAHAMTEVAASCVRGLCSGSCAAF